MKDNYLNKKFEPGKHKEAGRKIPKYTGEIEVMFVIKKDNKTKKFLKKPGELFPEFPIEEARNREDFIIVERS